MTDTDDLVARLRKNHADKYPSWTIQQEAADTIEELDRMHRDATADCIRANEEADKLAEALDEYGGHLFDICRDDPCNCGFSEALTIAQRRVNGEPND